MARASQAAFNMILSGATEPEALPPGQVVAATPGSPVRAPAEAYRIATAPPAGDSPAGQVIMDPPRG